MLQTLAWLLRRAVAAGVVIYGMWSVALVTLSDEQRQEATAAARAQLRFGWDAALPYLEQYMRQHEEALTSAQLMALGEVQLQLASSNQAIAFAGCCLAIEAVTVVWLIGLALRLLRRLRCGGRARPEEQSPPLRPATSEPPMPAASPLTMPCATPLRRRSLTIVPGSAGSARRSLSPGLKPAPAADIHTPGGGVPTPLWAPSPAPERAPASAGREERLVAMLNVSPLEELEKIKGIGKKTLQSIKRFRDQGQQFQRLDDLHTKLGLHSIRRFFPEMLRSV